MVASQARHHDPGRSHQKKMNRRDRIIVGVAATVIAVLFATIAVPSFVKARHTRAWNLCTNSLRMIHAGKCQAAMANGWALGTDCDTPTNKALVNQYIKGNTTPLCHEGGTYTYHPVGKEPTCSRYNPSDKSTDLHHLEE